MAGGDKARRARLISDLEQEARRLAAPGTGPLVRLLAGRAALARARLDFLRDLSGRAAAAGGPAASVRDLARRAGRAERDHAAAVRLLGAVRDRLAGRDAGRDPDGGGD